MSGPDSTAMAILLALGAAVPAARAAPATGPPAIDPARLETFVDGRVIPALRDSGIPGALVVVVRRDAVLLSKGYGFADATARIPVHAASTLFDVASIGKGMTAVITAQLLDENVLDRDTDVNRYLRSARVSGPTVTLRMLLAHRGGFDDDLTGLFVPFDGDPSMSRAELDRRLHPLVTPGVITAYDNLGFGLVGLVLHDVTGKPLPELFRERLFEPAGMQGAVLGRPPDGRTRLARCHTVQGPGAVHECEYWLYRAGLMGAGGVAASGDDMARYMRMLLNRGALDGRRVVSERAFADLTDFDHFRFHPGLPGGGHAFIQFEEFRGLEYASGGSMPGFSSIMKIYQDADVGIFVSFLGGQPGSFDLTVSNVLKSLRQLDTEPAARPGLAVLGGLADGVAEKFIPADRPRSVAVAGPSGSTIADEPLSALSGTYLPATAHSWSFVARIGGWFGAIRVECAGDDTLRLAGAHAALGTFHRVGPSLFENAQGTRLAFARLPTGRYLALGLSAATARQVHWYESPGWALGLFAVALLVGLSALVHLRPGAAPALRRLSGTTLVGLALVVAGLLAEWQWGVALAIVRGSVVAPALWRLALHGGALLLVWGAVQFLRRPITAMGRMARVHGWLLACAGISVPVALLGWRVLGAFPPWVGWS